jgi:hypothetical protein
MRQEPARSPREHAPNKSEDGKDGDDPSGGADEFA